MIQFIVLTSLSFAADPSFTFSEAQALFEKATPPKEESLEKLDRLTLKTKAVSSTMYLYLRTLGLYGDCNYSGSVEPEYVWTQPKSVHLVCQSGYYYLRYADEPMGLKLEARRVFGSDTIALYGVGFLKPYLENKVTYALKVTSSGLRAEIDSRSDTWFNGERIKNKQTIYDLCRQTESGGHRYFICERRRSTTATDDDRLIEDKAYGYYLMEEK